MTDEERIAGYREKRDRARDVIRQIDEGRVEHFDLDSDPAEDVTAEWRETQQQKVNAMGRLILASELDKERVREAK